MGGAAVAVGTLAERLEARRDEIEEAVLTRVYSVEDPTEAGDPQYVAGLKAAVGAAVGYGLTGIEGSPLDPRPVPVELFAQARQAARSGVSLDTVLRRYFSGYTLLADFIVGAAEEGAASVAELARALRGEARVFDRLIITVAEEYALETKGRPQGAEERRVAQVRMLLGGELVEVTELGYELDAWHLGVIATGPGVRTAIRELAAALDRRLLSVCPGDGTLWAWLGGRRKLSSREALGLAKTRWSAGGALVIGEPGQGIEGWRATHRQVRAALPIAQREAPTLIRYSEVALLAAALNDPVLAGSLRDAYLAPLEGERDGGAMLRKTLAAYLGSGRNASSAAAALRVNRNTVGTRLRAAEEKIGRQLDGCAAELETALRLRELAQSQRGDAHPA